MSESYRAQLYSTAKIDPENPPKTEQWFSVSRIAAMDWAVKVLARSPAGSVVRVYKQKEELVAEVGPVATAQVPVTEVTVSFFGRILWDVWRG